MAEETGQIAANLFDSACLSPPRIVLPDTE
jgi:hypothetical protein